MSIPRAAARIQELAWVKGKTWAVRYAHSGNLDRGKNVPHRNDMGTIKKPLKLAWSAWDFTIIDVITAAEANINVLKITESSKAQLTFSLIPNAAAKRNMIKDASIPLTIPLKTSPKTIELEEMGAV